MTVPQGPEMVEVDFVAPRHLAGGGYPAWITVPLHHACGWSYGQDPLMPRVFLTSPDQKAHLRLEPDPDGQWWTLHHATPASRPAWYASFGARTPVEVIGAFLDALTDPNTATAVEADPYEPLRQAGWVPASTQTRLVSPDATTYVQCHGPFFATTLLNSGSRPVWQARFGEHTPAHLLAAFTASLADPSPVARTLDTQRLPTLNPRLVTRVRREVTAEQAAFALEDRVRALGARRPALPTSPGIQPRPPGTGRTR
ncbi:DUF317 domain-containing protein [Streptomyces sp. NPDC058469]|uniref:DUF317 domain-containing protein n=1 Tax=Streptomyces sp. NPDC058469 TaxID=3346514 RepID=UPI0036642A79